MSEQQIKVTGNDYRAIIEEAKALLEIEPELLKIACPRCGTPLDVNKDGVRNCPMGHYRSAD